LINVSWPANAGHPGDACHLEKEKKNSRNWKVSAEPNWVARIRGP
jgi:hypothetical protein